MIDVGQILELHENTVAAWHHQPIENEFVGVLEKISQQHTFNFRLWHKEDKARCPNASDNQIAEVKRRIDQLNQQRNDWIEKIDGWIEDDLTAQGVVLADDAKLNTETPGSAIDRLSILALRLYHLREQLERDDVDDVHRAAVQQKLAIGELQRQNLATSLAELLADIYAGRKRHQTYRQMKMYNDPNLNPVLVAARRAG